MKKRILFIAFSLSTLMAIAMPGKNSLKSTPQEMDKFVTDEKNDHRGENRPVKPARHR